MPNPSEKYLNKIFSIIHESGAWSELIETMRLALYSLPTAATDKGSSLSSLLSLINLCCQAAGGRPGQADKITIAWLLFYRAAHLMDNIQDQDTPEDWYKFAGPGLALNVASSFYFCASLVLADLYRGEVTKATATEIVGAFYRVLIEMCNGQQLDLLNNPSLDTFWRIAAAKSGSFFGLASWSGARVATRRKTLLAHYRDFGYHLGMAIQIKDELEDVKAPEDGGAHGQRKQFGRSLPVIYALEVATKEGKLALADWSKRAPNDIEAAHKALAMIDACGAGIYMSMKLEYHRQAGQQALRRANPEQQAAQQLEKLILNL